jgi:hypothetical protein
MLAVARRARGETRTALAYSAQRFRYFQHRDDGGSVTVLLIGYDAYRDNEVSLSTRTLEAIAMPM